MDGSTKAALIRDWDWFDFGRIDSTAATVGKANLQIEILIGMDADDSAIERAPGQIIPDEGPQKLICDFHYEKYLSTYT